MTSSRAPAGRNPVDQLIDDSLVTALKPKKIIPLKRQGGKFLRS